MIHNFLINIVATLAIAAVSGFKGHTDFLVEYYRQNPLENLDELEGEDKEREDIVVKRRSMFLSEVLAVLGACFILWNFSANQKMATPQSLVTAALSYLVYIVFSNYDKETTNSKLYIFCVIVIAALIACRISLM